MNKKEFQEWAKKRKAKPITCFPFGPYKDVPFTDVSTKYLKQFVEYGSGTRELYETVEQIYWSRVQGHTPLPVADWDGE